MTDKQIIIYKKECYNEPHCSLNQVLEQLNAYKMEAEEGKEINAELKAENEELKKEAVNLKLNLKKVINLSQKKNRQCYQFLADIKQLKAEVKSKTEYIQEQRDIINQYSKEIEMYKKCQGKRASKREEELKAENDNIKETFDGLFKVQYKLADNNKKLRQCLTEIEEIAENAYCLTNSTNKDMANFAKQILQEISECEGNDGK